MHERTDKCSKTEQQDFFPIINPFLKLVRQQTKPADVIKHIRRFERNHSIYILSFVLNPIIGKPL